jgi:MFS family permease
MGGRKGGIVVATFQMMSDLGAVVGPLVAGFLVDSYDFSWAFAAGSALSLVAVILVVLMPETLNRGRQASQHVTEHQTDDTQGPTSA